MHYIKEGTLKNRLLALKSMEGSCTGDRIRKKIESILQDFDCDLLIDDPMILDLHRLVSQNSLIEAKTFRPDTCGVPRADHQNTVPGLNSVVTAANPIFTLAGPSLTRSTPDVDEPSFLCSADLEDSCDTLLSFQLTPKQRKSDEAARKQALMKSVTNAVSGIKERKRDLSSQFGDYIASNHHNLERDHPDLALELQIGVNKVLSDV
ncbi:hypothetical protein ACLKA6_013114 [Drosophila palustris]